MQMLVKMSDQKQLEQLGQLFEKIDLDLTGMISVDELRKAIKNYDLSITDQQVESIIKEIDYFGNGKINYTEFMTATLDVSSALDNSLLNAIFS